LRCKKQGKDSTAFSDIKWINMKRVLRLREYTQPVKEVPEDVVDLLYSQLMKISVVFGSMPSGNEDAKRLQFISPILLEVCYLFEGKVKISVEEDLKGRNIKANCHFEYILELEGHKVCIVEAKKDDIMQGMAQALLGDEVIADLENVPEVYAIVTNYMQWLFIKNTNDFIHQDLCSLDFEANKPTKKSISKIASKIYGLLSSFGISD
jgi:hypothetical protein